MVLGVVNIMPLLDNEESTLPVPLGEGHRQVKILLLFIQWFVSNQGSEDICRRSYIKTDNNVKYSKHGTKKAGF